jgi:2-keto-3-deoxy-6-phosphogluconate aldolase
LVNYPHTKKKLQEKVEFIAAQLKYEEIPGRKSAIEMLTVIANGFPEVKFFLKHSSGAPFKPISRKIFFLLV